MSENVKVKKQIRKIWWLIVIAALLAACSNPFDSLPPSDNRELSEMVAILDREFTFDNPFGLDEPAISEPHPTLVSLIGADEGVSFHVDGQLAQLFMFRGSIASDDYWRQRVIRRDGVEAEQISPNVDVARYTRAGNLDMIYVRNGRFRLHTSNEMVAEFFKNM